jgi:hypothetical protein
VSLGPLHAGFPLQSSWRSVEEIIITRPLTFSSTLKRSMPLPMLLPSLPRAFPHVAKLTAGSRLHQLSGEECKILAWMRGSHCFGGNLSVLTTKPKPGKFPLLWLEEQYLGSTISLSCSLSSLCVRIVEEPRYKLTILYRLRWWLRRSSA